VYAGNPDGYQDLPVLVEAMARVRAARGEAAPRLRLVGASWRDSEDGRAIAAAADEVVATADWPTARAAIATATVAAVPRTRCAGFPVKLLAALALGVPVVVAEGSAQGLPGEIVVRNGDPAALADALLAACDSPVTTDLGALVATCGWSAQVTRLLAAYDASAT
jgi:glycosyltransferase involved in cell wall biosynthesis